VYQAVIQVDKITYNKIMSVGGLFIGYDFCYAFDAIEILRCFNCNGFHHSSKTCTDKGCCPQCSVKVGPGHPVHPISDYHPEKPTCVNCVKLNNDKNIKVPIDHAAWDPKCTVYQRAIDKLKNDLVSK
jgi:hypothetical protein